MIRLINDSGILHKKIKNLDNITFDQIILAIHKVQDNIGITGTTALEAEDTIEGSVNSMKAAWQNLLTGIANGKVDNKVLLKNFTSSVKIVGKNLIPVVKTTITGLVDTGRDLLNEMLGENKFKFKGETVVRKIQETFKKLINTLEWFKKNKNLVVGSMKAITAAFVVSKINNYIKPLNSIVQGFGKFVINARQATLATQANTTAQIVNTGAQTAGATATGILTAATQSLSAAFKANPVGLIISGITTLITLYEIFKNKTDETTEVQKKESEEIKNQANIIRENKEAWESLVESQQKQIDTGMTEITHYESLYDELEKITDANGKVKKGYEERAEFIVDTLNDALGTEIKITDGVIKKYDDLKDSIQKVIDKKKAQIILDSQEPLYKEAIEKQAEATNIMAEAEQKLNEKKLERSKLDEELISKQKELTTEEEKAGGTGSSRTSQLNLEIKGIQGKIKVLDEETESIKKNYDEQESLASQYAYNIGVYEHNMAAAHKEKYDDMIQVNWNLYKEYQSEGDAEKALLESRIATYNNHINYLQALKEKERNRYI